MITNSIDLYKNAKASFQILNYSFEDMKTIYADGRLTHGLLNIGDVFTILYNYVFIKDDVTMPSPGNIDLIDEKKITLIVEKIFLYGKYLDEIEAGLTARVYIAGDFSDMDLTKYKKESWIELSIKI